MTVIIETKHFFLDVNSYEQRRTTAEHAQYVQQARSLLRSKTEHVSSENYFLFVSQLNEFNIQKDQPTYGWTFSCHLKECSLTPG